MTDNENAKALECSGMVGPIEILYRDKPWEELVTVGDVVGFLNLLKAENEELKCRNQNLTSDLTSAKAEIEELRSELIITRNNFENAKERYDEAVKIGQRMNEKLIDAYKKLQTAKSEAYKEFAERLKGLLSLNVRVSNEDYLEITEDIDDLVKELSEVSDNA